MIPEETRERIEKEAKKCFDCYTPKKAIFYESVYVAGSTVNWNKAIDVIMDVIQKHHVYGETTNLIKRDEVLNSIEALKIPE